MRRIISYITETGTVVEHVLASLSVACILYVLWLVITIPVMGPR